MKKSDLEFNDLERSILSSAIFFEFNLREICSNEFKCMNQIKNDGSIKLYERNAASIDNFITIEREGWVCKLCRDRPLVEDPIQHLLDHHHDYLIKQVHMYWTDYI